MVDSLLDQMKKDVVQPFSTVLDVFPRFIREWSRDQGKEIDLVIEGAEIEIDRRILEEIKDPLIHLVRNCLDHGIEKAAERAAQGKPKRGTIRINVTPRDGSNVELQVSDDGGGIDAAKVRAAAVKQGMLTAEKAEALDEKQAVSYIFESGVSTSPIVTNLSGRGLGLAIVKERVENLRGTLTVESAKGLGTIFHIVLPLTLARFRGIVVRVAERMYVVPTTYVERAARIAKTAISTVENRETATIKGEAVALARLADVLGIDAKPATGEYTAAIVLASGQNRIAFAVDEVIDEQEVLVKTLGRQLTRVANIAGATTLATGEVVPILNVPDLLKSAVRVSAFKSPAAVAADAEEAAKANRPGGGGLDHIADLAEEHPGNVRLRGGDGGGRRRRLHQIAGGRIRSRGIGCRHAAHERIWTHREDSRGPEICGAARRARHRAGVARGSRAWHRRRRERVHYQEQLRPEQPPGGDPALLMNDKIIRVLVVDDSRVAAELLTHVLNADARVEVVGVARDGDEAVEAVQRMQPDVITMDIHMPKMNGYEATRRIMETCPAPIVIVSGSLSVGEAATTFRAIEAGALAVAHRPNGINHPDHEESSRELVNTVKLMSEVKVIRRWPRARMAGGIIPPLQTKKEPGNIQLVAIGASTGGPLVLQTILSLLPKCFPVPVVIVQHMAPGFVDGFVEWLGRASGLPHARRQGRRAAGAGRGLRGAG